LSVGGGSGSAPAAAAPAAAAPAAPIKVDLANHTWTKLLPEGQLFLTNQVLVFIPSNTTIPVVIARYKRERFIAESSDRFARKMIEIAQRDPLISAVAREQKAAKDRQRIAEDLAAIDALNKVQSSKYQIEIW